MSLTCSAHISWLFEELAYLERAPAAARAGFHRIETAWPKRAAEREALPDIVAAQGLAVILLNCDAGDVDGGERGFLNDPSRREQAERAFLAAAELAQRLGAPNLNLLVGRDLPGIAASAQRQAVVQALSAFAAEASARGLRILVEAINTIENPGYLTPTPQAVMALIEECGSDALGVLLDVYHVARVGADPLEAIACCGQRIGHVQISDCPGRGRPGSGALDFPAILDSLGTAGYEGAIGLEYLPQGPTERSLELLWRERYPICL